MKYQNVSETDAQFLLERSNALPEDIRENAREAFEQFHASLCDRITDLEPRIRHEKACGGPTYYAGQAFAYVNIKRSKIEIGFRSNGERFPGLKLVHWGNEKTWTGHLELTLENLETALEYAIRAAEISGATVHAGKLLTEHSKPTGRKKKAVRKSRPTSSEKVEDPNVRSAPTRPRSVRQPRRTTIPPTEKTASGSGCLISALGLLAGSSVLLWLAFGT